VKGVQKQEHSSEKGERAPITKNRLKRLERLAKRFGEKTKEGILAEIQLLRGELSKQPQGGKQSHSKGKKQYKEQSRRKSQKKRRSHSEERPVKKGKPKAKPSKKDEDPKVPQCTFCGKPGHTIEKCWKKFPEQKPQKFRSEEQKDSHAKGRRGKPANTNSMKFTYVVDPYDSTKYRIPEDDLVNFKIWTKKGMVARYAEGGFNTSWEPVMTDREREFAQLEEDAKFESAAWQKENKDNFSRKPVDRKEQHARTTVAVLKNTVFVLDQDMQSIAQGTLFAPTIVGFLKHYFKVGTPSYVSRGGKTLKIVKTVIEDSAAADCWAFGLLESPFPSYCKNTIKVPTTNCRGVMVGLGDFETIKVNLGRDKVGNVDVELTYHAESFPKDCGRAVIDSEDNMVIGLNAGVYKGSGVAFGVPATAATLVAFESFLF
jgi:hypothetical protein